MNINQYENREMAKLAAAFGPSLMVLGSSGSTGSAFDVLIAAVGALVTSYAILWGLK
jgi:hypothetical protein